MVNLGRELAGRFGAGDGVRLRRGQVVEDPATGAPAVSIGGTPVSVHSLDGVAVEVGDPVLCALIGTRWYVLGAITSGLELVAPPVPPAEPAPPPTNPAGPSAAPAETGETTFAAVDSGTWSITDGQWNNFHGRHLVQGSWQGRSYMGAWLYGSAPRDALRGRTVLELWLRLPARYRVGSYNAAAGLHLIAHGSTSRGSVRPPGVAGPQDVLVPAGYGGDWVQLPAIFGQLIVDNGGGIGIQGEPYAGFIGAGPAREGYDPASGQLRFVWQR